MMVLILLETVIISPSHNIKSIHQINQINQSTQIYPSSFPSSTVSVLDYHIEISKLCQHFEHYESF
jgi:hypothetical protein